MQRQMGILSLVLLITVFSVPARADLVLSIASTTIPQGGTGALDVWLTSNAGPTSPDPFNDYGFQLQINGPHFLEFAATAGQDFSYLNDSRYVFVQPFGFNNSDDWFTGSNGGYVQTVNYPNDTFTGADSTTDLSTVSLTSGSSRLLLAAVSLVAPTNLVDPGDQYAISLVSGSAYFDQFGVPGTSIPFSSSPGTVTIAPASVPEPSTLILAAMAAGAVLLAAGLRRCFHRGAVRWAGPRR